MKFRTEIRELLGSIGPVGGWRLTLAKIELNIPLQAAEVQSVCMSCSSSRSLTRIGEGDCSIALAFERKE